MSGIYLHVPFCRTACHYCDFHFSTSLNSVDAFVRAVVKEIELRSGQWKNEDFRTLYLGGGTPSVLSPQDIARIIGALNEFLPGFNSERLAEATIEVNPEDLTEEIARGYVECGFDRISIGVQTFDDSLLNWMNRKHSTEQAESAVFAARKAGFNKISIDLIYGLPHGSLKSFENTVSKAFSLPIDHISCYALTVEPTTVLGARVKKGEEKEAPDSVIEADYRLLCSVAETHGFSHYEVSNWARNTENKAVHNSAYWSGAPYLGLGPGAHGFDGKSRYSVISNNPKYLRSIDELVLPDSVETLTPTNLSNEMMMTGLRTALGVDFKALEQLFCIDHIASNHDAWLKWTDAGAIILLNNGRHRISEKHWIIGDSIASDLIVL